MTLTAGVISLVNVGANTAQLASTAASGGTPTYTYQWYRSTVSSGFSPGGGNILTGQTALTLNDTNLIPNTVYYYKVVVTDAVPNTATSAAYTLTTTPASLNPNQFSINPLQGTLDLLVGTNNVFATQIDVTQATPIYPGQPVKFVNNSNGVPTVISAGTSAPDGYIRYDIKTKAFTAGSLCEIARSGSCMFLYSTAAIARGSWVTLDQYVAGGVTPTTGSSGLPIVGQAYDEAIASGQLIRVTLTVPNREVDS